MLASHSPETANFRFSGDLPESHKVGEVINKTSCLNPGLHKVLIVCAHPHVMQREKERGRKGKEGGRKGVRGEREREGGGESLYTELS